MELGKIIVIEGMDGAGKGTQSQLLKDKLEKEGVKVILLSFPVYELTSGKLVKEYLTTNLYQNRSDYNDIIGASNFYAMNRHQVFYGENVIEMPDKKYSKVIDYYNNGYVIICDRYTTSNLLCMAANLFHTCSTEDFIVPMMDQVITSIQLLEYGILQIPKPDLTVLLKVDPGSCYKNLLNRYNGDVSKLDKNEKLGFISSVYMAIHSYERITQEKTLMIDCMDGEKLLPIPGIQDKLYSELLRSGVL